MERRDVAQPSGRTKSLSCSLRAISAMRLLQPTPLIRSPLALAGRSRGCPPCEARVLTFPTIGEDPFAVNEKTKPLCRKNNSLGSHQPLPGPHPEPEPICKIQLPRRATHSSYNQNCRLRPYSGGSPT